MDYKIEDVAKLLNITNFKIYSYITKQPELRSTLKAKDGILTINDEGIAIIQDLIKGEPQPVQKQTEMPTDYTIRMESPVKESPYSQLDENVTVKASDEAGSEVSPADVEPAEEDESSSQPEASQEEALETMAEVTEIEEPEIQVSAKEEPAPESQISLSAELEADKPKVEVIKEIGGAAAPAYEPYASFKDFRNRSQGQPELPKVIPDITYTEMKETILMLREQLEIKDRQIAELSRLLDNSQILLKQEQNNYSTLENYLVKKKY